MKTVASLIQSHNEKKISYVMIACGLMVTLTFIAYLALMINVTQTGYAITSTNSEETDFLETISILENQVSTKKRTVVFDVQESYLDNFETIGQSARYQTVNTAIYSLAR